MVGAVFTEIFAADVFIAVFSVCTAYITALVAKKLHFVFLLSGEIVEFIQGFVYAKVGDYIGKIVIIKLDYKLRIDPRVVNMEKTNIRYLDTAVIDDEVSFISIDVSFISLKLVFPVAAEILKPGGSIVCLVKPQFEAGREQVGKNGIVRDKDVHEEVLVKVAGYGRANGLSVRGITFSPITGAKGNIEYLMHLIKEDDEDNKEMTEETIKKIVRLSHETLEAKAN